jgi:hypothetical protein
MCWASYLYQYVVLGCVRGLIGPRNVFLKGVVQRRVRRGIEHGSAMWTEAALPSQEINEFL